MRTVAQFEQAHVGDDGEAAFDERQHAADDEAGQRAPHQRPGRIGDNQAPRLAGVQFRGHRHRQVGHAGDDADLDVQFISFQLPAPRISEPVHARRADRHHAVGIVTLHALVPQLRGDRGTLPVDGVDDASPPSEHLVSRERRNGERVTRGGLGQPDSFGDDQSDAARGAPSGQSTRRHRRRGFHRVTPGGSSAPSRTGSARSASGRSHDRQ